MPFNPATYQLAQHSDAARILDEANAALDEGHKAIHAEHETRAEAWSTYWGLTRYQAAWQRQHPEDPNKYTLLRIRRPYQRGHSWIIEVVAAEISARIRRI